MRRKLVGIFMAECSGTAAFRSFDGWRARALTARTRVEDKRPMIL